MIEPFLLLAEAPDANAILKPELWMLPDETDRPTAANRLLRYTGYDLDTYLRLFSRASLLHRHRNRSYIKARNSCDSIFEYSQSWNGVIILSRKLGQLFTWHSPELVPLQKVRLTFLEWNYIVSSNSRDLANRIPAAVVPNPGHANIWWKNGQNRADALAFFEDVKEHGNPGQYQL